MPEQAGEMLIGRFCMMFPLCQSLIGEGITSCLRVHYNR
nr:MAG TPA: hypothetical protein [Caudoviricetes sp.]